jgi:multidrug efflux pump subunit AcrA (membrane-fusion protein)
MAAAIPFVMIAGAAISAMGSMQAARAQQTAANYNARLEETNAVVALNQSTADAVRFRAQADKLHGELIAGFGASGLGMEGTESVLADSVKNARLDEETIKYKGRLRSMGFYNSATLDRFSGENAVEQGQTMAASQFISGVGPAGATYVAMDARMSHAGSRAEYDSFADF